MAIMTARIEIPSDSLPLIGQLVQKLGGKIYKDCGNEELRFLSPPLPEEERVGRLLKGARLRAELTQKELAAKIGVPQSHISQYEMNKRKIPAEKAEELAKVLDTVASHFLPK